MSDISGLVVRLLRLMRFSLDGKRRSIATENYGSRVHAWVVPVTSALYRVVHDPLEAGGDLQTFHAGDLFPFCSECGRKVRYVFPSRVLRKTISS